MIWFAYQKGESRLHRLNPLTRLVLFFILMLSLTSPRPVSLALVFLLLVTAQVSSTIRLTLRFRNLLFFLLMAGLILWGEQRQRGWEPALLKTGAFITALYGGLIFTALNDPMDLGETLYRLTRRIPLFPAGQLMILITLTFSFLPMVGEEMQQLKDALDSRNLSRHPSPFRRIYFFTVPLISSLIDRSDRIAQAMYARSFRLDPTLQTEKLQLRDYLLIWLGILLLLSQQFLKTRPQLIQTLFHP